MGKRRVKSESLKMPQFSLKLPPELFEAIKARAAEEGRSPSNLARRLLEQGLATKASA